MAFVMLVLIESFWFLDKNNPKFYVHYSTHLTRARGWQRFTNSSRRGWQLSDGLPGDRVRRQFFLFRDKPRRATKKDDKRRQTATNHESNTCASQFFSTLISGVWKFGVPKKGNMWRGQNSDFNSNCKFDQFRRRVTCDAVKIAILIVTAKRKGSRFFVTHGPAWPSAHPPTPHAARAAKQSSESNKPQHRI